MNGLVKNKALFIFIIAIVSRLPLIFGDNIFLDGDEAIVGLMAKHFSEGKEFPLFFYGQSYGFSLFEVIPISLLFLIFGISVSSLKFAMLLLWAFGISIFYKSLEQISHKKNRFAPLLITLVFVFMPSYALWSMKARGGYLTAFFLSSVLLYLLFNQKKISSAYINFVIGLIITIIYQSQPLYIAGLIPFIVYMNFKNRCVRQLLSQFTGIIAGSVLFFFLKSNLSNFWSPNVLDTSYFTWNSIAAIPQSVYYNLTGSYNYSDLVTPVLATRILAILTTTLIFMMLAMAIVILIKKKKDYLLFLVGCTSIFFTLSYLLFMDGGNYRYLLPLSIYAILVFYLFIINLERIRIVNSFLSFLILLGIYSMYNFKNYSFDNMSEKKELVQTLIDKNIAFVYCEHGLLQWEIMFHSKEAIIARFKSKNDRYPYYIKMVDKALDRNEAKIGLVGFSDHLSVDNSELNWHFSGYYFIIENPPKTLILERGFEFEINN